MMSDECKIKDMEELLPSRIGESGSMKSQMLLIVELLRTFTDEDHGLSSKEIRDVIELRTGKRPSEQKVLSDIHELADNAPFGMCIEIPSRGESKGFRCTKTFISSAQARLLINMVRTCKFITPEQRHDLCKSLHDMVSYWQQDEIVESVDVDERELPTNQDVFGAADVAYEAIKKGKKVAFRYAMRNAWGKEYYQKTPDGEEEFEETPIALVFSFGNYYLETWSEEANKRFSRRLDRIRQPRVSDTVAVQSFDIWRLRRTTQERMSQQFDMWGDDITRELFLFVRDGGINYAYDRFGPNIKFRQIGQDGQSGYLCVRVQLGPTFYRWLFGMQGAITLAKPQSELWVGLFRNDLPNGLKPLKELIEDYEVAKEGLNKMLNMAFSTD